jgi:hypothetical protein
MLSSKNDNKFFSVEPVVNLITSRKKAFWIDQVAFSVNG